MVRSTFSICAFCLIVEGVGDFRRIANKIDRIVQSVDDKLPFIGGRNTVRVKQDTPSEIPKIVFEPRVGAQAQSEVYVGSIVGVISRRKRGGPDDIRLVRETSWVGSVSGTPLSVTGTNWLAEGNGIQFILSQYNVILRICGRRANVRQERDLDAEKSILLFRVDII